MASNRSDHSPTLLTLPSNTSSSEIIAAIEKDGAVIVKDLMSQELADQIFTELEAYINATPPGSGFTGEKTTRTGALAARSAGACKLIINETILDSVNKYLSPFCERTQLHLTQIIRIRGGQKAQFLHRDRAAWGGFIPRDIEPQLNMIWALTDFNAENGATQVVPGSHRWPEERQAKDDEITQAIMPRGSVLIYSGSVIHGGGENFGNSDRMGINITYALGWLRQEENQYLSCPPDVAKGLDPVLQALLGYTMGSLACGYYSQLLPAGEAKEVCAPEFSLGREPSPDNKLSIMTE